MSEEDESQMDETDIPQRLSDEQARDLLEQICDCRDSAQFQHLPIDRQRTIVAQAATQGAAINQLARITGLSYRQVYKTVKKKEPSASGRGNRDGLQASLIPSESG